MAALLLLLLLRHQARPFIGEDWLQSVTSVLGRFGQLDSGFSWTRGLHPNNFLSSSYGPLFYLYELARVWPFKLGLPFNEVTFRYLTAGSAFLGVVALAIVARRLLPWTSLALLLFLVAFSPGYMPYYRSYGAYFVMLHTVELLAAVSLVRFLRAPSAGALAFFYGALFFDLASTATAVNFVVGAATLLLFGPDATDGGIRVRLRELLGRPAYLLLAAGFLLAFGGVLWFNYRHHSLLVQSDYHYQGVYAHALQKVADGAVSPLATARVMAVETFRSVHIGFWVLLPIAIATMIRDRTIGPLGRVFLPVFVLAALQCLLLMPTDQVGRGFRFIYYCFPLFVVVAESAGRRLASMRYGGAPWIALLFAATLFVHKVRPISDLASVRNAEPPAVPEKALGYVLRHQDLVEDLRRCAGADRALDGPRIFFLERVGQVNVFSDTREASTFCGLLIFQPESTRAPRIQKILERSRLGHHIRIGGDTAAPVDLYLNDAMWARWGQPSTIDAREYSRLFSRDYGSIDALFGPRWLAP
jgi:hypothetical protein